MGLLAEYNAAPTVPTTPELGFQFVDADTVKTPDGVLHRLQGFDAPEISKLVGGELQLGTAGGQAALAAIQEFAIKNGFTNLKELEGSAAHGRKLSTLVNDKGESLSNLLLKTGVFNLTPQSTPEQVAERAAYKAFGDISKEYDGDLKLAAETIQDAMVRGGHDDYNFKQAAFSELERMAQPEDERASTVAVRHRDRTIDNASLNPWSDSWSTGVESAIESAYGMAELLGHTFDSETLSDIGEAGIYRARSRMGEMPTLKLGFDDIDGFGSAVEMLTNNIAISLPYMGATAVGMIAAPFTYGASLALPVSLYSGQVWNEQEEKNSGTAVAAGIVMSVLDRLGLKGSINAVSAAPKEVLEKAIEENAKVIAKETNNGVVTDAIKEVSREEVMKMTKASMADLSAETVAIMKDQLKGKGLVKNLAAGYAKGYTQEGVTEGLQEAIGYLGAHVHDDTVDFSTMGERMLNAAAIGGMIGGSFGTAGSALNLAGMADAAWRKTPQAEARQIQAQKYAEMEERDNGFIDNTVNMAEQARQHVELNKNNPNVTYDINDNVAQHVADRANMSLQDKIIDALMSTPSLWRKSTQWIFNDRLQEQSRAMRQLADMFNANVNKVFSGPSFESFKHHLTSKYQAMVGNPKDIYAQLNDGKRPNAETRGEISDVVYEVLQRAVDSQGNFDPNAVERAINEYNSANPNSRQANIAHADIYKNLGTNLQNTANKMHNDQRKYNPELGRIPNYLATFKSLNKQVVADDKVGFADALMQTFGFSQSQANEIVENILDTNTGLSFELEEFIEEGSDGRFSVVKGGPVPSAHKRRSLGLATKPMFKKFFEKDIFANVEAASKSAARYQAYQQFVGKNGSVIAKLLEDAKAEGVSQKDINRVAAQMKDYLDAESGNFKRPTTEFGKQLVRIQKNLVLLTTFAGLPLAVISSLVELAITQLGMNKDQLIGEKGSIATMGRELGKMLWSGMQETYSASTNNHIFRNEDNVQQQMRDLGYYEWSVGAATKTGVTETSALKQKYIEMFFKWNGLQGFTNMTRAVRVAIAGDYIYNHLETYMNWFNQQTRGPKTNEVAEAEMHLRNLGIDPVSFGRLHQSMEAGQLTESGTEQYANIIREATFNFVNDAIMMPNASNRPLFYQDPRFALFNQFQGFISTFQAQFIPKLWNNYIKNGSPAMKYNAFAVMASMIMMGYASQELRDRIKFGKHNPYLDTSETIRRAISSSGLLGTGERVINTLFPMYETRSDNVAEWTWNEVVGQSPALGIATQGASGLGDLMQGDIARGANKMLRLSPIGAFTETRKSLAEMLEEELKPSSEWNY